MYSPKGWLKERGASVLAALVLVAILGAVLIIFQYVRSSSDFAYESASLTAAADAAATPAAASPAGGATLNGLPPLKGEEVIPPGQPNAGKTTYPCSQTEANPSGAAGAGKE